MAVEGYTLWDLRYELATALVIAGCMLVGCGVVWFAFTIVHERWMR